MPIALLNFPTDLLGEVFRLCDPFDLYKLSKCSKRARKSIKLGNTKSWKITFSFQNDMNIWVDRYRNYYFKKTENPEDYFKREHMEYMYVQFPDGGALDFSIDLIETFGIRIVGTLSFPSDIFDNFSNVVTALTDRNMEIEEVQIGGTEAGQDVFNFMPLMNQMNTIQDFRCFPKFPSNFHHLFDKYPNNINIHFSSWFTIDQLLDCTSVHITLFRSTLNNQDLNMFLQKWKKAGTFPNLRSLIILHTETIDNQSRILDMVPPIKIADNPRIRVSMKDRDSIVDPVQVKKDDGTVGWLVVEDHREHDGSLEFLM
ncbi:hypothetical protein B9Z55_027147 [Caenorhabditis nigoni]|uniref:F-box domain-containing protein n=1 Tax=Caenorhabditis nigoni TaxID=1611254 RepID=A0A2G5SGZ1_9PELO|nr:hypothetical protein B9Z55_027147 [Caenorhabditis nigoni]